MDISENNTNELPTKCVNPDADIYNGIKQTPQHVYDSYNQFIFSDDTRVFNKMIKRTELYLLTKDMIGDVLEFGVFKGASIGLWIKLLKMYEPNSITKVIGFDFFDSTELINGLDGLNKNMMTTVVGRVTDKDLFLNSVTANLQVIDPSKFMLIKGDAVNTSKTFINKNPGLKIKLLYMDLDVGEPTYKVLLELWDKVCINGIIVFDEYAYHQWDESIGVDNFLKTIEGKYIMYPTNIFSPTAYIKKIAY